LVNDVAKEKDVTGFGKRLKALREARELSQSALGKMCEPPMGYQDIARLERGSHTPSWATVIRICAALEISPEEFLPEGE
jgi:transcriptional regulator with XRE-family HTH domain